MSHIIIAVGVAALAGGVVGWIAGVAKGQSLMETALLRLIRTRLGDEALDRVLMGTGRRLDR